MPSLFDSKAKPDRSPLIGLVRVVMTAVLVADAIHDVLAAAVRPADPPAEVDARRPSAGSRDTGRWSAGVALQRLSGGSVCRTSRAQTPARGAGVTEWCRCMSYI
jgi:hypothetical protein